MFRYKPWIWSQKTITGLKIKQEKNQKGYEPKWYQTLQKKKTLEEGS